jgi:hypothetical protein
VTSYPYPSSFPSREQLLFLRTITAPKGCFQALWEEWKSQADLDAVDTSTYRLLPSLYLRMAQEEGFHDAWLGRIKGVYRQGWARNHMLLNTTAAVVNALHHHGIPSILLKGISLLLTSYKDVGGRMMGDADILVPLDKAVDACNLMLSLGWKCRLGPDIEWFDERNILPYVRATHEKSFVNSQGQILDLHFISPFRDVFAPEQIEVFWQKAVPITINGHTCKVLSPELVFLHVCQHGYRLNQMPSYRWVLDALRTVQSSNEFNWPFLISFAQKIGLSFHLKMAAAYLTEHFDLRIPEPSKSALENYCPPRKELHNYYRATSLSILNKGNLPILWAKFRLSNPSDSVVSSILRFPDYLKETYLLNRRRDLLPLYFKRFRSRLSS